MDIFGRIFSSSDSQQNNEQKNEFLMDDAKHNDVPPQRPAYTLDDLKRAGLPLKSQISPYLQVFYLFD